MNKLNLYPPDDLMVEVKNKAKKDDRSLSFVSMQLLRQGLKAERGVSLSANSIEEIERMAAIKSQSVDEAADFLVQYAIKEIKRQREKEKKRHQAKKAQKENAQ